MSLDKHPLVGTLDRVFPIHRARYLAPSMPLPRVIGLGWNVIGRVKMVEIDVPWKLSVDAIIYQVGATAAGNARMALYREGPTIDLPDGGELIFETGDIAQSNPYRPHMVTVPEIVLTLGRYYGAIQGDGITGTFMGMSGGWDIDPPYFDQAYGAFTDPCPATGGYSDTCRIYLRVARNLV